MKHEEARAVILALLAEKGRVTNRAAIRAVGGNEERFEDIREELILEELADDFKGVGLKRLREGAGASARSGPSDARAAFISYRREGGADTARVIRTQLEARNVSTFLDVDDLGSQHFDERLLREIGNAPNFILILSPGSLDRCWDSRDWLRREIVQALETRRNIVPVLKNPFEFPPEDELPRGLEELPRYNCVLYSHSYFGAMVDKIISFLEEADSPSTRTARPPDPTPAPPPARPDEPGWDVFISHKSEDQEAAREVYRVLTRAGMKVFLSEISLAEIGMESYQKAIDESLETATHLVLVTSTREHVESPWVEAEWRVFQAGVRAGEKNGNLVPVLTDAMSSASLPPALQVFQAISMGKPDWQRMLIQSLPRHP